MQNDIEKATQHLPASVHLNDVNSSAYVVTQTVNVTPESTECDDGCMIALSWIAFVLGFLCWFPWCFGFCFLCSKRKSARIGGILSVVFLTISVLATGIILIVVFIMK